eukprot:Sspe_Gene.24174::Locus_9520_Transcript_1_1_Confidence_1.000_Length_1959::g.24174::m.24174
MTGPTVPTCCPMEEVLTMLTNSAEMAGWGPPPAPAQVVKTVASDSNLTSHRTLEIESARCDSDEVEDQTSDAASSTSVDGLASSMVPRTASGVDWSAFFNTHFLCSTHPELDDMLWFCPVEREKPSGRFAKRKAKGGGGDAPFVRRRTQPDTWPDLAEAKVDWRRTLYLNIAVQWQYELTVAVVRHDTSGSQLRAIDWVTRRVFASPSRATTCCTSKEATYTVTYPDLYFNIEDWHEAFGDMRVSPGLGWALELTAITGHAGGLRRRGVIRGRLKYDALSRQFQLGAGAARVEHTETMLIHGPGGRGTIQVAVSIAPEEEERRGLDDDKGTSLGMARRLRQRLEGRGSRVAACNTPTLQCCLKWLNVDWRDVIGTLEALSSEVEVSEEPWIHIPTEDELLAEMQELKASMCSHPTTPMQPFLAKQPSFASPLCKSLSHVLDNASPSTPSTPSTPIESYFTPQTVRMMKPEIDADAALWKMAFAQPPLFIDAVLGSTFQRWATKKSGKRFFGQQAYEKRMFVLRAPLLYYFMENCPDAPSRGCIYLRGARLAERTRGRSPHHALDIICTVPRRPTDRADGDRVFSLGFETQEERRSFAMGIATSLE